MTSSDRPVQGLRVPEVHNPFCPGQAIVSIGPLPPKGVQLFLCDISELRLRSGTSKPASTGASRSPEIPLLVA